MKITYQHFRVPSIAFTAFSSKKPNTKGQPPKRWLARYLTSIGRFKNNIFAPNSKGGLTVCTIISHDGIRFTGVALCSLSDNFSYKEGRRKAHNRAKLALWAHYTDN